MMLNFIVLRKNLLKKSDVFISCVASLLSPVYTIKKLCQRGGLCDGLSPFSSRPPLWVFISALHFGKLRKARWDHFKTRACFHFMFNFLTPKPPGFPTPLLQPRRGVSSRKSGRIFSLLCSPLSEPEHTSQREACRVSALTRKTRLYTRETERPELRGRIVKRAEFTLKMCSLFLSLSHGLSSFFLDLFSKGKEKFFIFVCV